MRNLLRLAVFSAALVCLPIAPAAKGARKAPVTGATLFPLASITESFTVTALGTLVDQGNLDWDKPVREYLPGFRMYDAVATEQLTTRDMVMHRSGLPRHDLA